MSVNTYQVLTACFGERCVLGWSVVEWDGKRFALWNHICTKVEQLLMLPVNFSTKHRVILELRQLNSFSSAEPNLHNAPHIRWLMEDSWIENDTAMLDNFKTRVVYFDERFLNMWILITRQITSIPVFHIRELLNLLQSMFFIYVG